MTLIHWYGAKAAMIFHGSFGVVFHFTAATAGACADIRFDDWFQVITPAGAFKFMTDDSAGFAGTGLFNCGAERSVMEVATSNQNLQMCDFSVALPKGIKFEGHAGAGHAISARPFQFEITAVPTNCTFEWDPNESSTWTGDYIVQCAGTENGLRVVAPVAFGNLMNATSSRTIDSFPGFGFQGQGTDYGQLTGMLASVGPSANGQFNRGPEAACWSIRVGKLGLERRGADHSERGQRRASMSTNTGRAPRWMSGSMVGKAVWLGTMISSPGPIP